MSELGEVRDTPQGVTQELPREIFRKIRRLEIRTRRLIRGGMAGAYRSAFRGAGLEFAEVRDYHEGDDVRWIDWNVTARMGRPYVKEMVEERELNIFLAVDSSGSMRFGSTPLRKMDLGVEVCGILALNAVANGDRIALVEFGEQVQSFVPPRKAPSHALRVIRDLFFLRPSASAARFEPVLQFLDRIARKRSVVFLISDFLVPLEFGPALARTCRKHDVIAVRLVDPRERDWPSVGYVRIQDLETGHQRWVDTGRRRLRDQFHTDAERQDDEVRGFFRRYGVDLLELSTDQPSEVGLSRFFFARARRT